MFTWLKKLCHSLLMVCGVSCIHHPVCADSTAFSRFYFLGDSLTDMGNNPDKRDTPALNKGGGPTWAHWLAKKYGRSNDGNTLAKQGYNFAYSGATTTDVIRQIDNLLAHNQVLDSKALYAVWVGANDMKNAFGLKIKKDDEVGKAIVIGTSNISKISERLHNAGARFILVANLPDLSKTPFIRLIQKRNPSWEIEKKVKKAINGFNQLLLANINNINANVILIDVASIFDYVYYHPEEFDLVNSKDPCHSHSKDCERYLFFDGIHPTVAAQRLLADFIDAFLKVPSHAFALTQVPLGNLRAHNQVIRQQLYPLQSRVGWKSRLFFGGYYMPDYTHQYQGNGKRISSEGNNWQLVGGVILPFTEYLDGGVALGYAHTTADLNSLDPIKELIQGRFDFDSYVLSLFGTYAAPQVYINAILETGLLKYRKISRYFAIGPRFTEAHGNTRGKQYGAQVEAGYFLANTAQWQTGPIATLDYQRIVVKGFTETSAVWGTAAAIDMQQFDSLVTGLGWQVGFKHQVDTSDWLANLSVAVNKQWKGGEQKVRFKAASLNNSKFAYLPIDVPKRKFVSISANISAAFKKRFTVSAGYTATIGEHRLREHFISAGISWVLD